MKFLAPLSPRDGGKLRGLGRGGGHFLSLWDAFISTLSLLRSLEPFSIGIGIDLKHVYNQDFWYWSWIISYIKTSLGIGLESFPISRLVLVLVLTGIRNQDNSWYWSQKNIHFKTCLGIGLERKLKSRQVLVLVLKENWTQDKSWSWSWTK